MKKLSIALVVVLLLTMIPAAVMAAPNAQYMGTTVRFYCTNGGRIAGYGSVGRQWSQIRYSTGTAYFLLPSGRHAVYYNGVYAGSISVTAPGGYKSLGVRCSR